MTQLETDRSSMLSRVTQLQVICSYIKIYAQHIPEILNMNMQFQPFLLTNFAFKAMCIVPIWDGTFLTDSKG
jgi:hypothetical protein